MLSLSRLSQVSAASSSSFRLLFPSVEFAALIRSRQNHIINSLLFANHYHTKSNSSITRNFSSSSVSRKYSEEAFRKFRSFRSGDHIHKSFKDSMSYSLSTAFYPKDRLKNNYDSYIEDDDEEGEFIKNYKKNLNLANEFIQPKSVFESPTGEDNYIMAHSDAGLIFGVFDGVGGWAERGFDSSAISRELSNNITKLYLSDPALSAKQLLIQGFRLLQKEAKVKVGSTTACFGVVDGKTGKFDAVNLGDSWFGVFRKVHDQYKCIYQSKEQCYYFNAPYQLSIIPQEFLDSAEKRGAQYLRNEPEESDDYTFNLESQDVVIFASDGLTDNVMIEDMELYLNGAIMGPIHEDELAEIDRDLVRKTVLLSMDPGFNSVFSQKMVELTGQYYVGGKKDDITSVMLYVD